MMDYIEREDVKASYLEDIKELCAIPSISSHGEEGPMLDAVKWIERRMIKAGIEVRVLPNKKGFPLIYGFMKGEREKTLLFYNHYDVVSAGSLEDWDSDPFVVAVRDGRLIGRGVADNKGNLLSRIHALEALKKVYGSIPVNVKFLVDGEEEIGSPCLGEMLQEHRDLFAADACVWESAKKDEEGNPTTQLGNKGLCRLKIEAQVAKRSSHSSLASLYPNALWRLVWALSHIKDEKENILVPGFYDRAKPLTPKEEEVCKELPIAIEKKRESMGIKELLPGSQASSINKALYFEPSINIQHIGGGDPGGKTVNPAQASAYLDCRLVHAQHPEEIYRSICCYLESLGFYDLNVEYMGGSLPQRTPLDHPFLEIVDRSCQRVYGKKLVLLPTSPGSGPREAFAIYPDLPIVGLGVAHNESGSHGPKENIMIEDYILGAKHIAALLLEYGNDDS